MQFNWTMDLLSQHLSLQNRMRIQEACVNTSHCYQLCIQHHSRSSLSKVKFGVQPVNKIGLNTHNTR
jgi:hypothetical protein